MTRVMDLGALPAPDIVEPLDYEAILAAHRADLLARHPQAAPVLALESEPLNKLLQAHAWRELLYRQRVNEAARAHLLAFATGADLDHKGAFYGLPRQAGEADERYRQRIQLRIAALAGNGTAEHYELTAVTASPDVRSAAATQPFPGRVQVLLWVREGADASAVQAQVQAALNAPHARPLGVPVSVALARARPIHVTARITRERGAPPDLAARLAAALPAWLDAHAALGRDVPRSWLTARLHVQGVAAVTWPDAARPAEHTPLADDEYAVAGEIRITDAGEAE